jgi:hypothetical protein
MELKYVNLKSLNHDKKTVHNLIILDEVVQWNLLKGVSLNGFNEIVQTVKV